MLQPRRALRRLLLPLLLSIGCAHPTRVSIPPSAETVSLLGDTLWTVPIPVPEGRWRVRMLQDAREEFARRPGTFQAALDVARHTAGLGRLREAIRLYEEAGHLGPSDPRPFLARGELFLRLREFSRAATELRIADRLGGGRRVADLNPQPDGTVEIRSTAFDTPYTLGLVYLFTGDTARARPLLAQAATQADGAADAARAAFWYLVSGRGSVTASEAKALMPERERGNTGLAALRDINRLEEYLRSGVGKERGCDGDRARTEEEARTCFLAGLAALEHGDRAGAAMMFGFARRLPDWSREVAIAAEAELARLDEAGAPLR